MGPPRSGKPGNLIRVLALAFHVYPTHRTLPKRFGAFRARIAQT
jgi:hypothetical protein